MPTYEYQCQECQKEFSQEMSISEHERARPVCPGCKSRKVTQLISGFQVVTSRKS